jgi:putative transposase
MARNPHIPSAEFPYHVCARRINREGFLSPLPEVWAIMEDQLFFIHRAYEVKIHSFVLMSNHFHLLISTPHANLSSVMNHFSHVTSKILNFESGHSNQNWGSRNHQTLVRSYNHFCHVYKYVYRNPVQAGIVGQVEDYKFSTLPALLGKTKASIPLVEDTILFGSDGLESVLGWLNTAPEEQHYKDMKRALKRREFKLPKKSWKRSPHDLDSTLY